MRIEITTKNGSVFVLDQDAMTWECTARSRYSGLKTVRGKLLEWPIVEVGGGVQMCVSPLTDDNGLGWIYTSDVQSWRELDAIVKVS